MSEGEGSGSDFEYSDDDDVMLDSQADGTYGTTLNQSLLNQSYHQGPEDDLSDGDDGAFAMDESTILKGKAKAYEVDHKSLSVEELEKQMEKDANQFAGIFGLDVGVFVVVARTLTLSILPLASHGNANPAIYELEQRAGYREIHGGSGVADAKGWDHTQCC